MAIIPATRPKPYEHEWEEFQVPLPQEPPTITGEAEPLTQIAHTAHVHAALSIVTDGIFRPRLIFDESRLNTSRTLVTWLSPNEWPAGYRYGNVRFLLPWQTLLDIPDIHFYWVEAIRRYHPVACRILLTPHDHPELQIYEPATHRGPWRLDTANSVHYWNRSITLEIMLEAELQLTTINHVDFVLHNPVQCSIGWHTCPDRGLSPEDAGARFLAALASSELTLPLRMLVDTPGGENSNSTRAAVAKLLETLDASPCTGQITAAAPTALSLCRAFLGAFARQNNQERDALVSLFQSTNELRAAVRSLMRVVTEQE